MRITVLTFARLRELVGTGSQTIELPEGSTAQHLWTALAQRHGGIAELAESTRVAVNGRIVEFAQPLRQGDEVALLPPVGGG